MYKIKKLKNKLKIIALIVSALIIQSPLQASTLPKIDFKEKDLTVSAGSAFVIFTPTGDISIDYAVNNRINLGASFIYIHSSPERSFNPALRTSLKIFEFPDLGFYSGITLSGGFSNRFEGIQGHFNNAFWIQPAVNISYSPVWIADWLTFRLTLGPMLFNHEVFKDNTVTFDNNNNAITTPKYVREANIVPLWPNIELGFRINPNAEITLGGNSLIGLRWTL